VTVSGVPFRSMARKTKIIATMGPAIADREKVRELIVAGMNVARLNFSHGGHKDHRRFAEWVRWAAKEEGIAVALLQDIQGPKIRLGTFPDGPMTLSDDETVVLVEGSTCVDGQIPVVYPGLLDHVKPGDAIMLADGLVKLTAAVCSAGRVEAKVTIGGVISDKKGLALPESDLDLPALTEKDRGDLAFGMELGVDLVAASFVKNGDEIREIRDLAGGVPVIAKVELASAYKNLDDIIAAADGVMVARGDLGVELPPEELPNVQRDILKRTNKAGLISVTATEMLESMIYAPRPTRAEVTDVANAVTTGSDAVMLSAETATGNYPVAAVEIMSRICETAEEHAAQAHVDFLKDVPGFASAMARAAVEMAHDLELNSIVAFTESGTTARLLSKYRPDVGVVAFTPHQTVYNRMALYRGVSPALMEHKDTTDLMMAAAEKRLEKDGIAETGEAFLIVAGTPPKQAAAANLLKLHVIGERDRQKR